MDPFLGRTLSGRFRLLELIGVGGMGRVYKALQSPLERVVAVKVLCPSFSPSRDPNFQQRFALEASLTARLSHPNTVSVIDYGQTEDGVFFIAMELLEGQTLAQYLKRYGPLPWPRAVGIAQQICRSLREAHRLNLIHRDLKPANVMLLSQEADHDLVKVLDFGLVKSLAPEAPDVDVTQGNVFLASPQYMAPEQARHKASPRSDIYSLGVVLYQMLVGRPPFVSQDSIDLIVQHLREPPPRMTDVQPQVLVPTEVEAVVRRCLEKGPSARYGSMDELLDALKRAARANGEGSGPHPAQETRELPAVATQPLAVPPLFRSVLGDAPAALVDEPSFAIDLATAAFLVPRRRRKLPWVLGGLGGTLAVVVAVGSLVLLRGADSDPAAPSPGFPGPAPVPALALAVPAPAPAPQPRAGSVAGPRFEAVRFRVNTVPSGAWVSVNGRRRGKTPLSFEVAAEESGEATANLAFSLEGYHPLVFTAGGYGPEVMLVQRLQRRSEPAVPGPPAITRLTPSVEAAPSAGVAVVEPAPPAEPLEAWPPLPRPAAPAPAPGQVLPFSAEMTRPELLDGPSPVYTRQAQMARVEGAVVARCVVTEHGRLEKCRLIKSVPHMEASVLEALEARRYRPATLHGRPVAVEYVLNLRLAPPR